MGTVGHRVSQDWKDPAQFLPGPAGEVEVATSEAEVLEKWGPRLVTGAQVEVQLLEHSPLTCSGVEDRYGNSGVAPVPRFLLWNQVQETAPLGTHQWLLKILLSSGIIRETPIKTTC